MGLSKSALIQKLNGHNFFLSADVSFMAGMSGASCSFVSERTEFRSVILSWFKVAADVSSFVSMSDGRYRSFSSLRTVAVCCVCAANDRRETSDRCRS